MELVGTGIGRPRGIALVFRYQRLVEGSVADIDIDHRPIISHDGIGLQLSYSLKVGGVEIEAAQLRYLVEGPLSDELDGTLKYNLFSSTSVGPGHHLVLWSKEDAIA